MSGCAPPSRRRTPLWCGRPRAAEALATGVDRVRVDHRARCQHCMQGGVSRRMRRRMSCECGVGHAAKVSRFVAAAVLGPGMLVAPAAPGHAEERSDRRVPRRPQGRGGPGGFVPLEVARPVVSGDLELLLDGAPFCAVNPELSPNARWIATMSRWSMAGNIAGMGMSPRTTRSLEPSGARNVGRGRSCCDGSTRSIRCCVSVAPR